MKVNARETRRKVNAGKKRLRTNARLFRRRINAGEILMKVKAREAWRKVNAGRGKTEQAEVLREERRLPIGKKSRGATTTLSLTYGTIRQTDSKCT